MPKLVDGFTYFFAADRVPELPNHLSVPDDRSDKYSTVFSGIFLKLGEFQTCVRKNERRVRVHLSDDMGKNVGLLASRIRNADFVMVMEFRDQPLRQGKFDFGGIGLPHK